MVFKQYLLISTSQNNNTLLQLVPDSKEFTVIPDVLMDASQFTMRLNLHKTHNELKISCQNTSSTHALLTIIA